MKEEPQTVQRRKRLPYAWELEAARRYRRHARIFLAVGILAFVAAAIIATKFLRG